MGKHKNSRQEKLILKFMEANTDFAKGFLRGDKCKLDSLWTTLMKNLNSEGPPQNDASGWKKVWLDWKCNIRKNLAHNKRGVKTTGGGCNNLLPITAVEDAIAKITGIYNTVEGIKGCTSFGVHTTESDMDNTNLESEKGAPVASSSISAASTSETRVRGGKSSNEIEKYMESQKGILNKICSKLNESVEIEKENKTSLKCTYRALEKLGDILKETNTETHRHHIEIEKLLLDKNEIERRKIEIEEMKLDMQTTYVPGEK